MSPPSLKWPLSNKPSLSVIRDVRTVCYQSLVKFLLQLFTLTDATCPEWQSPPKLPLWNKPLTIMSPPSLKWPLSNKPSLSVIRDVRTVCYQSLVKFLLQLFTLTDATCPEWQSNEWITDKTREGSNTCKRRIIIIINNYSKPRIVERERYIHCSFATLEWGGGRLRCI